MEPVVPDAELERIPAMLARHRMLHACCALQATIPALLGLQIARCAFRGSSWPLMEAERKQTACSALQANMQQELA